jgi:hypothetical protein
MNLYFRFVRWLQRYEESPRYNKWLAGLYQLLWTRWCGHDWRFSFRMARIYWSIK